MKCYHKSMFRTISQMPKVYKKFKQEQKLFLKYKKWNVPVSSSFKWATRTPYVWTIKDKRCQATAVTMIFQYIDCIVLVFVFK